MRCAPDAGSTKTQLVGILGPVIDQLVDAFHRQMIRGDDDHRGGTNHSDHREVGHSVTRIVAQHRVSDRAGIDENERVPIGSRMCDRRGSIDPGCSWSVFRNDGIPAEYLAQSLSDHASREVGNSARRKAKDQVNGLRGELLCLRLKIEVPSNRRHTAEQGDELAPLHRADPKPKEHGEYNRLEPCIEAKAVRLCPPWTAGYCWIYVIGCKMVCIDRPPARHWIFIGRRCRRNSPTAPP